MSGSRTHNLLIVCTIPDGTRLATIPRRGLLPKGAASMRTGAALALVLVALLASPVGAVTVKIDEFPIPTAASSPRSITVGADGNLRSEEHTSELQSRFDLVCRLLLEKKKKTLQRSMSRGYV